MIDIYDIIPTEDGYEVSLNGERIAYTKTRLLANKIAEDHKQHFRPNNIRAADIRELEWDDPEGLGVLL